MFRVPLASESYLLDALETYRKSLKYEWDKYPLDQVLPIPGEVSEQALVAILKENKDIPTDSRSAKLNVTEDSLPIIHSLHMVWPGAEPVASGQHFYPPGTFMAWHTNSTSPAPRLHCSYVQEGAKSFFRYQAPSGEIITDWDIKGWNLRSFRVPRENERSFWHCSFAGTPRLSVGFRVYRTEIPEKLSL